MDDRTFAASARGIARDSRLMIRPSPSCSTLGQPGEPEGVWLMNADGTNRRRLC